MRDQVRLRLQEIDSKRRFEGNVLDAAGENDGNNFGATFVDDNERGNVLSFDGAGGDYVDVGNGPSNYDDITVSAWARNKRILVSNRYDIHSYGTWYYLSLDHLSLGDNSIEPHSTVYFNTPTLDENWHHIVYTKVGTTHTIYVDGELDNTFTRDVDISQDKPTFIGHQWTLVVEDIHLDKTVGEIDEVMIFNRALNEDEVKEIYESQNK